MAAAVVDTFVNPRYRTDRSAEGYRKLLPSSWLLDQVRPLAPPDQNTGLGSVTMAPWVNR